MNECRIIRMAKKRNVNGLIKALAKKKDSSVRIKAAEALGKLHDPCAMEPLIQALGDQDSAVIRAAAESLRELKAPRAIVPLIKALDCDNSNIYYLLKNDWSTHKFLITVLDMIIEETDAMESLIGALYEKEPFVRKKAAEGLGKLKDPRAVEPLIKALANESDYSTSVEIIEALAELGDWRAVEPIIKALDQGKAIVASAKALGRLKDPRAVNSLVKRLSCPDNAVLSAVADALGEISDPRAIDSLVRAFCLIMPSGTHRRDIAKALEKLGEPKWIKFISGTAGDFRRLKELNDPRLPLEKLKAAESDASRYSSDGGVSDSRW